MLNKELKFQSAGILPTDRFYKEIPDNGFDQALGSVMLIGRIEEEYGIDLEDHDIRNVSTFQALVDLVYRKVGNGTT